MRRGRTNMMMFRAGGAAALALALLAGPAAADYGPPQLVSVSPREQGDGVQAAALSADGRFLAFAGSLGGVRGILRRDLSTGTTDVVAGAGAYGGAAVLDAALPSISADGRRVSFTTAAALDPAHDTNAAPDVYVRDMDAAAPMLAYRREFQGEKPHAILTLQVVCAEDEEEAQRLATSVLVSFARLRTGQKAVLLPPDEAAEYPFTPQEAAVASSIAGRIIVGTPETVCDRIAELAARTQADEVMVTTMVHGHEARLRSFELIAGSMRQ